MPHPPPNDSTAPLMVKSGRPMPVLGSCFAAMAAGLAALGLGFGEFFWVAMGVPFVVLMLAAFFPRVRTTILDPATRTVFIADVPVPFAVVRGVVVDGRSIKLALDPGAFEAALDALETWDFHNNSLPNASAIADPEPTHVPDDLPEETRFHVPEPWREWIADVRDHDAARDAVASILAGEAASITDEFREDARGELAATMAALIGVPCVDLAAAPGLITQAARA